jgi:hypothetical protein
MQFQLLAIVTAVLVVAIGVGTLRLSRRHRRLDVVLPAATVLLLTLWTVWAPGWLASVTGVFDQGALEQEVCREGQSRWPQAKCAKVGGSSANDEKPSSVDDKKDSSSTVDAKPQSTIISFEKSEITITFFLCYLGIIILLLLGPRFDGVLNPHDPSPLSASDRRAQRWICLGLGVLLFVDFNWATWARNSILQQSSGRTIFAYTNVDVDPWSFVLQDLRIFVLMLLIATLWMQRSALAETTRIQCRWQHDARSPARSGHVAGVRTRLNLDRFGTAWSRACADVAHLFSIWTPDDSIGTASRGHEKSQLDGNPADAATAFVGSALRLANVFSRWQLESLILGLGFLPWTAYYWYVCIVRLDYRFTPSAMMMHLIWLGTWALLSVPLWIVWHVWLRDRHELLAQTCGPPKSEPGGATHEQLLKIAELGNPIGTAQVLITAVVASITSLSPFLSFFVRQG